MNEHIKIYIFIGFILLSFFSLFIGIPILYNYLTGDVEYYKTNCPKLGGEYNQNIHNPSCRVIEDNKINYYHIKEINEVKYLIARG